MYKMKIPVPRSFPQYKRQGSDLHLSNLTLGVTVFMYYFNQRRPSCTIPQIHLISANILSYVYFSLSTSAINYVIFIYISSSKTVYKIYVSVYIFWESHLLINHISSIIHSMRSVTTGEQFSVKCTPAIWLYFHSTRNALYQP